MGECSLFDMYNSSARGRQYVYLLYNDFVN